MIETIYKCDDCGRNVSEEAFRGVVASRMWCPESTDRANEEKMTNLGIPSLGPPHPETLIVARMGWCKDCLDKHMPDRTKRKPKEVPSMSNQREAFLQGYNAHKEGKQQTKSPYPFRNQDNPESLCQNWHAGWRKAAEDFCEAADSFTDSVPDTPQPEPDPWLNLLEVCSDTYRVLLILKKAKRPLSGDHVLDRFREAINLVEAEGKPSGKSRYACRGCGRVSPYELADIGGATRWVCPDCAVSGRSFEIPGGLGGRRTRIKVTPDHEPEPGDTHKHTLCCMDCHSPVIGADGKAIVVPPGVESHGRCKACYEKIDRKKAENER